MTKKMEQFEKMTDAEIATFVAEKRELVQTARFGTMMSDVKSVSAAKRDIARALTAQNNRTAN